VSSDSSEIAAGHGQRCAGRPSRGSGNSVRSFTALDDRCQVRFASHLARQLESQTLSDSMDAAGKRAAVTHVRTSPVDSLIAPAWDRRWPPPSKVPRYRGCTNFVLVAAMASIATWNRFKEARANTITVYRLKCGPCAHQRSFRSGGWPRSEVLPGKSFWGDQTHICGSRDVNIEGGSYWSRPDTTMGRLHGSKGPTAKGSSLPLAGW
jgi:hypothetical protein